MSIRKLPIKIVIYYSNFGLLGALIIAKISGWWFFITHWFFYTGLYCISIYLMHIK
jgi:hypothetical protein